MTEENPGNSPPRHFLSGGESPLGGLPLRRMTRSCLWSVLSEECATEDEDEEGRW